MKQKLELLTRNSSGKQFRQIKVLISGVMRASDKAFTLTELHCELQKYGYGKNLQETRKQLNLLLQARQVFVSKDHKKKYYYMI